MADWYRRIDGSNIYSGAKIVNEDYVFKKAVDAFRFADYVLLIRITGRGSFTFRHNMVGQNDSEIKSWISEQLQRGAFGGYNYNSSAILQVSWDNYYSNNEVSNKLTQIFREAGYNL